MARLHSETIPTSTLAATARVVDGFVTTQSDHQGSTGSFIRAFTATGIRKDGIRYTYSRDLSKKAPEGLCRNISRRCEGSEEIKSSWLFLDIRFVYWCKPSNFKEELFNLSYIKWIQHHEKLI